MIVRSNIKSIEILKIYIDPISVWLSQSDPWMPNDLKIYTINYTCNMHKDNFKHDCQQFHHSNHRSGIIILVPTQLSKTFP